MKRSEGPLLGVLVPGFGPAFGSLLWSCVVVGSGACSVRYWACFMVLRKRTTRAQTAALTLAVGAGEPEFLVDGESAVIMAEAKPHIHTL